MIAVEPHRWRSLRRPVSQASERIQAMQKLVLLRKGSEYIQICEEIFIQIIVAGHDERSARPGWTGRGVSEAVETDGRSSCLTELGSAERSRLDLSSVNK